MSRQPPSSTRMDDLLKKIFADDLPADVAAGMRGRIERFRAGRSEADVRATAWAWFFSRSLWAALSVLMLVAGILLQGSKSRSPLADRIATVKIAQANLGLPRR